MKVRPLGNRVVIRRDPAEKESKGGIIIPDSAQQQSRSRKGKVLDVGPGIDVDGKFRKTFVEKGQRVIYTPYAGSEVDDKGDVLIMRDDDILGVIEEE